LLIAGQLTFGVMNVSAAESSALAMATAEVVPSAASTVMSAAASGTYEHPKLWQENTTIGAIHKYVLDSGNLFFAAKFDGNASDHNWYFPTGPYSSESWEFKGAHAGTYADPKEWDEPSYIGAIHKYVYQGKSLFFSARLEGNASLNGWHYPTSPVSNEYWEYKGAHAGTYADPKEWNELTRIGAIHKYIYNRGNLYFAAKFDGVANEYNKNYYPAGPYSNDHWDFRGTRAGTYADPKNWREPTYVGAIHQYSEGDSSYFISKVDGLPEDGYRVYPTDKKSNANWTYAGTPSYIVMTSDPQYPWTDKDEDKGKGKEEKELSAAYIHAQYQDVNSFREGHPALDIPVYVNGDITAFGHGWQLNFMKDRFKEYFRGAVFLGLGNHDYQNNVGDCVNNGCARDSVKHMINVTETQKLLRPGMEFDLEKTSDSRHFTGSLAYSISHRNLHVVQTNNSPNYSVKFSSGGPPIGPKTTFDIRPSLSFIDAKMTQAQQNGKVNILVTHKPSGWKDFGGAQADAFRAMLKKNKVAAVFAGHFHSDHGQYNNPGYFGDIPVFLSGSASYENYLIVESVPQQKKLRVYSVLNNNHATKTLLKEIDY
jgi:hypothetical protein